MVRASVRASSSRFVAAMLVAAAPSVAAPADSRLPAGTALPVAFETTVSSATSNAEDRVLAKVRADVRSGGRVVVPAGSELRGHVISARRSGKVKGRAHLSLRFTELSVGGKTYPVSTARISLLAAKTHGRDAKVIGGGAAAGALVGAIADGGKGAGVGALVGGGAGTGVVLATRGKEVTLPAGARWRVRLLKPLALD
jgi:hypothetical protein